MSCNLYSMKTNLRNISSIPNGIAIILRLGLDSSLSASPKKEKQKSSAAVIGQQNNNEIAMSCSPA